MVDPLSQQIVQNIGSDIATQTPAEPSAVSADDAANFQDMVGGADEVNSIQPTQTSGVQDTEMSGSDMQNANPSHDNVSLPTEKSGLSLGDRILQGLERTQNDIQNVGNELSSVGNGNEMANMLEMQFKMGQFSTNQQLLGQVGSKTSQGVQTLLKGQ